LTIGQFTTFQTIASQSKRNIEDIMYTYLDMKKVFERAQRIFELINYKPNVSSKEKAITPQIKGKIELKNIKFCYPTRPNVAIFDEGLNLTITEGESIAIVGASGSGKSTLASLILRMYDVPDGEILIDDVNIKDYCLKVYHDQVGYVSQDSMLFSGTIEDNIRYSMENVTQADLEKAAELSNCLEFINDKERFPEGWKTLIGNKGMDLSGGQKQRLSIARALIKNSKILVFDEATSNLDAQSESEVQAAIEKIIQTKCVTSIIIAHRLSTIKKSKRIVVLKKGKIVEIDSHKNLLKLNGYYKELIDHQLELTRTTSNVSHKSNDKKHN